MTLNVEQTRKILFTVNAALTAAVVFAVLIVARDAVFLAGTGGPEEKSSAKATSAGKGFARTLTFRGYAPILDNNVFGFDAGSLTSISKGAMVPQGRIINSPASVSLQVFGTVAWDGGTGYAFIKDPGKDQSVVKTGEDIPGSGRLERVYADHIVLTINGKEYTVYTIQVIPAESLDESSPKSSGRLGSRFARLTGKGEYAVDRIAVEDSINNPERLLRDARMLPHYNDQKKQEGFSLSEVRPDGIYHMLGLRNKDIMLSVNGLELSDPGSALQAFTALKGAKRISVNLIRDGAPMTLNYNLR